MEFNCDEKNIRRISARSRWQRNNYFSEIIVELEEKITCRSHWYSTVRRVEHKSGSQITRGRIGKKSVWRALEWSVVKITFPPPNAAERWHKPPRLQVTPLITSHSACDSRTPMLRKDETHCSELCHQGVAGKEEAKAMSFTFAPIPLHSHLASYTTVLDLQTGSLHNGTKSQVLRFVGPTKLDFAPTD